MITTTRWELPLLAAGQAQKEVTHNEALLAIDRLLQLSVVSRSRSEPPEDAAPGDMHIVGPAPTGAWVEAAGKLAALDGASWTIAEARPGCLAWIVDEQEFAVLSGNGWSNGWPVSGLRIGNRAVMAATLVSVPDPAGGAMIDIECRSALAALLETLKCQGIVS